MITDIVYVYAYMYIYYIILYIVMFCDYAILCNIIAYGVKAPLHYAATTLLTTPVLEVPESEPARAHCLNEQQITHTIITRHKQEHTFFARLHGHCSYQDPPNQDPLSLNWENAALRTYTVH